MSAVNFRIEESPDRVFNRSRRSRSAEIVLWFVPALFISRVAQPWAEPYCDWLMFALYPSVLLALLAYQRQVRRRVRESVRKRTGADPAGLPFVGVSFGNPKATYGGEAHWDVGFLASDEEGIYFFGDFSSWHLPRDRMVKSSLSKGALKAFPNAPITLMWRDVTDELQVLTLSSRDWSSTLDWRDQPARLLSILAGPSVMLSARVPVHLPPTADEEGRPLVYSSSSTAFP